MSPATANLPSPLALRVMAVRFPTGANLCSSLRACREGFRLNDPVQVDPLEQPGQLLGRKLTVRSVPEDGPEGMYRSTGRSMRAEFAHLIELEDGRIARFVQYTDTFKVAEAMGLVQEG